MPDIDHDLKKRFTELAGRAISRGCYCYTEFLTEAQQDVLSQLSNYDSIAPYIMMGGYEAAERKIARFGSEDLCGYTETPPLVCLLISPLSKKFADPLTHRDFLGALMSLGLRREVLGDVVVQEKWAYLFCFADLAGFICDNLQQVRHTAVACTIEEALPENILPTPECLDLVVSSLRLDVMIAAVYKLSRQKSQTLISQGRVFICDRPVSSNVRSLLPKERVSVRGYGRFSYGGLLRQTAKGRLRVTVLVN